MPDLDVEAYKREVFGQNGQSSTHTPTPLPTTETQNTATTDVVSNIAESTQTQSVIATEPEVTTPIVGDVIIPDAVNIVKEQLGVESWDEAKAALAELAQLKVAATTKEEVKYANEQSKALYEAIIAGESDKVYEILDTQKKISSVGTMKPVEAIKLYIQQTNKNYKPIDVEDVFEEKYSYPDKPEQRVEELDDDFKARQDKWNVSKEKIDRRIERDAATAKTELTKLSAELKLPEIQKVAAPQEQANEDQLKELQKEQEAANKFYSKLSPKDIQMVFKFNDEASKLAFDIVYEPEKEGFESAKALASDMKAFFGNYYEKDGSPKRTEFLRDLYAGRNVQKIVSEAIVQAVNQERIRSLKYQKNIGDGTQRNYVLPPVSEVEKLKAQVFGK